MVGGRHTLLEKYLGSYYKEEYALISGTFENVSILLGNQGIGATGFKDAQGNKHCTNRPPKIRGLLKFLLLI